MCRIEKNDSSIAVSFNGKDLLPLSNSFTCEFIPLEITQGNENLLSHVHKAEIVEDKLFVLDIGISKSLQVYDMQGKYITSIGRIGDGPGEYAGIINFLINKEKRRITIVDSSNRFLFYNLDTYQEEGGINIPFNFSEVIEVGDNYLWANLEGFKEVRDLFYLKLTDATCKDIKYMYPVDFSTISSIWLGNSLYFIDGKVHYAHPMKSMVYEVNTEGLNPVYELSTGTYSFLDLEDTQSISTENIHDMGKLLALDCISGYALLETKQFILINFFVGKQAHIGLYDRETRQSWEYGFKDFVRVSNLDGVNMPFVGIHNESFITTISASRLKKAEVKNEQLKAIAQHITDEDNPIICLIKFNRK